MKSVRLNNLPNMAQARGCQGWSRKGLRLFFLFCFRFRKTIGARLKLLARSDRVKCPHTQIAARNRGCATFQRAPRGCGINWLYHYLPPPHPTFARLSQGGGAESESWPDAVSSPKSSVGATKRIIYKARGSRERWSLAFPLLARSLLEQRTSWVASGPPQN